MSYNFIYNIFFFHFISFCLIHINLILFPKQYQKDSEFSIFSIENVFQKGSRNIVHIWKIYKARQKGDWLNSKFWNIYWLTEKVKCNT